ncbi:hypothetical protein [Bradyrhizobium sp. RDM4]|uniref:hypothetical protein n=1 Tax=Bradyrhizobium sp. RDM4 TaxID=3378765 RepID=UPI0038FC240A
MVATAHTEPLHRPRQPINRDAQCVPREVVARAISMAGRQDSLGGTAGEKALSVVETKIWEEARGLARIAHADRLGQAVPRQFRPLQEEAPKAAEVLHRESVHGSMIEQDAPRSGLTPLPEGRELRMRKNLVIGTVHHCFL